MRLALKAQAKLPRDNEDVGKAAPSAQANRKTRSRKKRRARDFRRSDPLAREGRANGKLDEQSHATGAAGESPAMLGGDPQGYGVPIPGGKRSEAMPDARQDKSWRA